MQQQRIYITPEGYKVIATFYPNHVYWYYADKPSGRDKMFNRHNDYKTTFLNKVADKGWKEFNQTQNENSK